MLSVQFYHRRSNFCVFANSCLQGHEYSDARNEIQISQFIIVFVTPAIELYLCFHEYCEILSVALPYFAGFKNRLLDRDVLEV